MRRQRDVDRRAGVPGALAEQQVGVAHPLLDEVVRLAERGLGVERVRRGGVDELGGRGERAAPSGRERVGRPDADRPLLERGVGRVVGGRLGPVHDLAGAGLAGRPRGGEQRRRPARPDPVAPPAAGAEQQVPGAGDGDVAEPDLLGEPEVLPLLDVVLQRRLHDGLVAGAGDGQPQPGQLLAVGEAQVGGHGARVLDPGVAGVGLRRELVGGHARHGDDVPLQPLGGVPGEQLDGLGVDRDLARLQAALALLRVAQVPEERRQRRQLGQLGELGGDAVQRVEMGPGAGRAHAGSAGQLGLQTQRAGDLVDQVGERLPDPVAQVAELAAEPAQPAVPGGGVGVRPAEVVEGLDDAAALGRRLDGGCLAARDGAGAASGPVSGRAASSAARSRGPIRQRAPVSSRPRASPAVGSTSTVSVATTSETSGTSSSPPRPTTSTGTSRRRRAAAMPGSCLRARTSTAAVGGPPVGSPAELRVGAVPAGGEPVGEGLGLLGDGLVQPDGDRPLAGGRRGREVGQRVLGGRQHRRDRVGHREDRLVVAPARREGQPLGTAPVAAGEGAVEALDGAGRGTAPAVDRLAGVADGEHRMAAVPPEQRLEHAQLADAGVLVLVEEHDLPAGPLAAADLRCGDGDLRGVGDLVGVVDGAGGALARLERLDQRQQGRPRPLAAEHLQHRGVRALLARRVRVRGDLRLELRRPGAQGVGGDVVLAELGGERQDVLDRGEQRQRDVGHVAGPRGDDARRLPPAHGRTEDARAGLHADAQAVLGDQRGGVAVVGRHGRLGDVEPRLQLGAGSRGGGPAHRAAAAPARSARWPPCG